LGLDLQTSAGAIYQFGQFEVNASGELFKNGRRVKLQEQPFRLLVVLLENAGEVVSREELRSRIWQEDTFVDFDGSLRVAVRKLREALDDDAESPRYVETIPKRGYRFLAAAVRPAEATLPPVAPSISAADERQDPTVGKVSVAETVRGQRNWHARKWLLVGAVSLLALVAIATYIVTRSRSADAKDPKITSLAVLPLKNLSGDPAQEYFADGMTEEVIGHLSMIRGLRVISRTSVMQFKDTQLLAPEIARKLGVDALVEGSIIREGNRIRVHAQLIRASTDEHFWSETYDRELGDAFTLESEVAQSIAQRVEVTVTGEERARLVAARPVSPEAYESYLQGLVAKGNSRAEVERRIAYFDEAIRKDPTFAPAYVGLADAYGTLGTVFVGAPPSETRPRVISAARKALELDPDIAGAHVLLANTYTRQWKWAEAEAEYRRALDLNPNDATAHEGFSDVLLCHGRTEEALAWARRARDLDPLGTSGHAIGWTLFNTHRYDEAIREFRNALEVRPNDVTPLLPLGWALLYNHQAEEAIRVWEKAAAATDRSPAIIGNLIWAYAHAGRRADALRLLGELKKTSAGRLRSCRCLCDRLFGARRER
jgi:TolB-like protein/DNA-binding winged helix-turn-helix (wHTH) protein/Flp pilus assembly protein TadD